MKLSEAIRLGAMLRPQCTDGNLFSLIGGVLGSCAIGAAFDAVGLSPNDDPAYLGISERLYKMIYRRNDGLLVGGRKWRREEIAEWLVKSGRDIEIQTQPVDAQPEVSTTDPRVAEHA